MRQSGEPEAPGSCGVQICGKLIERPAAALFKRPGRAQVIEVPALVRAFAEGRGAQRHRRCCRALREGPGLAGLTESAGSNCDTAGPSVHAVCQAAGLPTR